MPSSEERLVEVELLLTHLQRDFEQLNVVVLQQQQEIAALRRELDRLYERFVQAGIEQDTGDPLDERPPHY